MEEEQQKPVRGRQVWATEETRRLREIAKKRAREVGQIMLSARRQQRRTIAECARHAGVSKGHYQDLEQGKASLTVRELEGLMAVLDLPIEDLIRPLAARLQPPQREQSTRSLDAARLSVNAQPGETLQVVLDVHIAPPAASPPPE